MKTTKQLLGAVSAFALVAMTSAPALAQGTSAGSTITNNVTVSFNVGGVTMGVYRLFLIAIALVVAVALVAGRRYSRR